MCVSINKYFLKLCLKSPLAVNHWYRETENLQSERLSLNQSDPVLVHQN